MGYVPVCLREFFHPPSQEAFISLKEDAGTIMVWWKNLPDLD
jgi:hypothetical protein